MNQRQHQEAVNIHQELGTLWLRLNALGLNLEMERNRRAADLCRVGMAYLDQACMVLDELSGIATNGRSA